MGVPQIRVCALHVRAAEVDRVVPFRNDLEDALRTASLPFGPNAVLRIRRLDLGRVPAGISRQALSRLVARRLGRIVPVGAGPGRPLPVEPKALVFRDWVALAGMALDIALGYAPMHWALAASFPALDAAEPGAWVAGVLEKLIATSGPAAPGRLAATAIGLARLIEGLERLGGSDLVAILKTLGIDPAVSERLMDGEAPQSIPDLPPRLGIQGAPRLSAGADADPLVDAPRMLRRALAEGVRRWDRRDPRLVVLIALVARALAGSSGQLEAVARVIAWQAHASARPARDPIGPAARETTVAALRESGFEAPQEPLPSAKRDPLSLTADGIGPEPETAEEQPPDPRGEATPLAGFWFLLAALRHAGAEDLDRSIALPVALAALQGFADRIGLRETDPAFAALGPAWSFWAEHLAKVDGAAVAVPARLRQLAGRRRPWVARYGRGRAVMGLVPGLPCAVLDAAALARERRICPQMLRTTIDQLRVWDLVNGLMLAAQLIAWAATGRGWRRLASVPGHVWLTATHLDITFDARHLDIGVRLACLDIDPGWVPWLGRVVTFHYDYSQVRDHARVRREDSP